MKKIHPRLKPTRRCETRAAVDELKAKTAELDHRISELAARMNRRDIDDQITQADKLRLRENYLN